VRSGGGRRRQAVYVARTRDRLVTDELRGAITTLSSDRQKVGPPEIAVGDDGLGEGRRGPRPARGRDGRRGRRHAALDADPAGALDHRALLERLPLTPRRGRLG